MSRTIKTALEPYEATSVPQAFATWPCPTGLAYYDCQKQHTNACPGKTLGIWGWVSRIEAYWKQNPVMASLMEQDN